MKVAVVAEFYPWAEDPVLGVWGHSQALAARDVRLGGHGPVQHDNAHVGARAPRGERLAVRPDAEDRVVGARVELGNDGDPHRCVRSVRSASSRRR